MGKRIILISILLGIISLTSCSVFGSEENYLDRAYEEMASDHPIYYGNFLGVETLDDVVPWIWNFIDYASEDVDQWNSPQLTLIRGYGDCEDIAILAMNIAYVALGVEFDLVLVNLDLTLRSLESYGIVCPYHSNERTVVGGGNINHAMLSRLGKVYEAQQSLVDPYLIPVEYVYRFKEVLK